MKWMDNNTDFKSRDIKVIASHQVWEFGKCCHCGRALKDEGMIECKRCGAMNYNFAAGERSPLGVIPIL